MPTAVKRFPFNECDAFIDKLQRRPKAIKIFAVGDSWLAAPGGWWSGESVVRRLNDDAWVQEVSPGHPGFNVLSIAKVGCTIAQMANSEDWSALAYLDDQLPLIGKQTSFDAFIVSAGGNDFIPKIRTFVNGGNGSASIDAPSLNGIFDAIKNNWVTLRSHLARWNVPILTNGYGPIVPTLKQGTTWLPVLGVGPWVGPYLLRDLKLSQAAANAIADDVMQRFNVLVSNLPGVQYFDLATTVDSFPASYWHDEIHFIDQGWEQVARVWLSALNSALNVPMTVSPSIPVAGPVVFGGSAPTKGRAKKAAVKKPAPKKASSKKALARRPAKQSTKKKSRKK